MDGPAEVFRQIVDSSDDGIWVFDASGRTVYTNPKATELLGWPPDEIARLTLEEVLGSPGRTAIAELHRTGTAARDVECTYRRKDGTPVRVLVSETVHHDEQGRVTAYVHRLTHDAEQRALLGELSRSREQLDEAQAIARVGSWEIDLDTDELTWSRQLYAMLELDPSDFVPTREGFLERVVEADRQTLIDAVALAEESAGEFLLDVRVQRADGGAAWMRLLGRVACDESGRPVRMGGTVQDITEVKEAELQLLDSVILNALMQVMATTANDSETLVEALEMTRSQLLAHDDWHRAVAFDVVRDGAGALSLEPALLRDDEPDRVPTPGERLVAERVLASRETVFEEDADPQHPSIGFLLTAGGGPLMVIVITNVSPFERHAMLHSMVEQVAGQLARVAERERANAELAAARDAAMEASRLKSEFLATMSHEIRTPMNGVIGLNELLLRSDLDGHQRRLAQGMQVAGQALLGLINDILDFSKIEAGELELEVVEFDVRPVFDQAAAIVSATAADKGIALEVSVAPEVPERLVGDPTRFGQILSNLVSNAVKFTADGSVTVRADLLGQEGGVAQLRVEVADTGVGIGPVQMARLFEPFRQADASTTRTFGGTGLGLAISRQLVNALKGEIGAESVPGRGSTFWFTATMGVGVSRPERVRHVELTPEQGDRVRAGHVLVVEDNEINQLVALGLLEALGYTAEVAAHGNAAVAMAATAAYDAILMDVQMPGMDGYTASRLIREREQPGTRVPIIAMTASAVVGERERCEAAGMDDFLTKPVDTERLAAVLRAHVPTPGAWARPGARRQRTAAVLDQSRLGELVDMGERAAALVTRAVDNFVSRIPATLAELHQAVEREDPVRLRTVAHGLRGSALNLGANRVAEVSLELETLGEAGTVATAAPIVDELRQVAEEAAAALVQYRAGYRSAG